jgi:sensor histidine kinase regulating citrate/malate metabolism
MTSHSRRKVYRIIGFAVYLSAVLASIGWLLYSRSINGMVPLDMPSALLIGLFVISILINWVYHRRIAALHDDFAETASRLEQANSQIGKQKQYYAALGDQMNEIRAIKHDIHHVMQVTRALAEEGRIDELKSLLQEYGDKTSLESLPVFCENIVANSIIGHYHLLAKDHEISLESRCRIHADNPISDSDLCVVLGNMLENAVEACLRITSGSRFICIEANSANHHHLIRIRNSYNPGTVEQAGGRLLSSKQGKPHGFGLSNIEKIIASYNGTFTIEHNRDEFILMAAVPEKQDAPFRI